MPPVSTDTIPMQAADWFARLQGGADAEDRAAFARWRDADPAHAAAFARVAALWGDADLAAALFATAAKPRHAPPLRLRRFAMAAAALLALWGGVTLTGLDVDLQADHSAPAGLPQRVALADGSVLLLDAGAAVRIDYSIEQRAVTLLRGRVFAAVQPDPARPFRIRSGDVTAQALGTGYSMAAAGDGVTVAVQHGRVAVTRVMAGRGAQSLATLTAGEAVALGGDGAAPVPAAAGSFAWTENRLAFTDRPLGAVLAELDRYWPGLIWLRADDLADLRVSGSYRLDDPPAVVAALAAATGARVTPYGGRLLVVAR
jgi:transmembrane sensor